MVAQDRDDLKRGDTAAAVRFDVKVELFEMLAFKMVVDTDRVVAADAAGARIEVGKQRRAQIFLDIRDHLLRLLHQDRRLLRRLFGALPMRLFVFG